MELQNKGNAWIKMGRLYRMLPMLKHLHPLLIPVVILAGFTVYSIVDTEPQSCTCEQQFKDDELRALGMAGNKKVQNYLNHVDDSINCEARRAQLLKELEHK